MKRVRGTAIAAGIQAGILAGLVLFAAPVFLMASSAVPRDPPASMQGYPAPGDPALREEAERLRAGLDLDEEAAQVLLIGIEGTDAPDAASLGLLARFPVGGVILFGFNIPSKAADLASYTAALQDAAAQSGTGIPLAIAVDHEGGSVFRFRGEGITHIPPPSEVGTRGSGFARALGEIAGAELRSLGVNMALAPVVELLNDGNKRFLGSRSYGRSAETVDAAAGAYIEGLQSAGTAAVAKHFPGNAADDPHETLPRLNIDRAAYESDFAPRFEAAIGRGVAGVMLSHVICPVLDRDRPATLSPAFAGGELKGKMGFAGLVLTDDLYMKALAKTSPPERSAVDALKAGADLLMLTWKGGAEKIGKAIAAAVRSGDLPRERLADAVRRVIETKLRFRMSEDLDPAVRERRAREYPALVEMGAVRIRR